MGFLSIFDWLDVESAHVVGWFRWSGFLRLVVDGRVSGLPAAGDEALPVVADELFHAVLARGARFLCRFFLGLVPVDAVQEVFEFGILGLLPAFRHEVGLREVYVDAGQFRFGVVRDVRPEPVYGLLDGLDVVFVAFHSDFDGFSFVDVGVEYRELPAGDKHVEHDLREVVDGWLEVAITVVPVACATVVGGLDLQDAESFRCLDDSVKACPHVRLAVENELLVGTVRDEHFRMLSAESFP